ncbi:hypothetical protein JL720_5991 [Aureococcus anophagefferens]|nr:hypothetical protein JL720_5991 [Aureococcus anophagefferens]
MAADDIMAFMTRVKRKLVDDDAQYATFVRALHRWEQQAIGTDELEASVTSLLADDEGLLRDFARLFAPRAPGGAARGRGARGREAALLSALMAESAATRPLEAARGTVAAAVFGAESPATRAYRGRVGARYAGPLAAALENSPFAEYQVSAEAFRALHAQLARPAGGADERLRLERDAAGAGAGHE